MTFKYKVCGESLSLTQWNLSYCVSSHVSVSDLFLRFCKIFLGHQCVKCSKSKKIVIDIGCYPQTDIASRVRELVSLTFDISSVSKAHYHSSCSSTLSIQHLFLFFLWNFTFHFIPLPKLWHLFEVGTSKSFNKVRVKSGSYLKRNSGKISIIFVVQHKRLLLSQDIESLLTRIFFTRTMSRLASVWTPDLLLELRLFTFRTFSKEPDKSLQLSLIWQITFGPFQKSRIIR